MARFWADLDAPRWVYRLGVLQTAILILFSVLFTLSALPLLTSGPAVGLVAVPWAFVALFAWATAAWRRGRPWAWWTWAVLGGLDVVFGLVKLGAVGSSWSAWYSLAIGAGTLVLLSHPANRGRVDGPVEPLPLNAHPAYVTDHR